MCLQASRKTVALTLSSQHTDKSESLEMLCPRFSKTPVQSKLIIYTAKIRPQSIILIEASVIPFHLLPEFPSELLQVSLLKTRY
jgi:hypothetical protein